LSSGLKKIWGACRILAPSFDIQVEGENAMKSNGSLATTTSAGILLVLMLAAGAAHSFPCVACEVSTSYHAAVRVYDRARAWGVIAHWWIDPESAPAAQPEEPSPKPEDVCQARPADGRLR
jgi:hypothetical protein